MLRRSAPLSETLLSYSPLPLSPKRCETSGRHSALPHLGFLRLTSWRACPITDQSSCVPRLAGVWQSRKQRTGKPPAFRALLLVNRLTWVCRNRKQPTQRHARASWRACVLTDHPYWHTAVRLACDEPGNNPYNETGLAPRKACATTSRSARTPAYSGETEPTTCYVRYRTQRDVVSCVVESMCSDGSLRVGCDETGNHPYNETRFRRGEHTLNRAVLFVHRCTRV